MSSKCPQNLQKKSSKIAYPRFAFRGFLPRRLPYGFWLQGRRMKEPCNLKPKMLPKGVVNTFALTGFDVFF